MELACRWFRMSIASLAVALCLFQAAIAAPESEPAEGLTADASPSPPQFDSGNDPTIVRKRLTFRNEYLRFGNGVSRAAFVLFSKSPIRGIRDAPNIQSSIAIFF